MLEQSTGQFTLQDFTIYRYGNHPENPSINAGKIGEMPRPRLFVSGIPLSATGGHGDLSGFLPYLRFDNQSGVVDGVDEIRKTMKGFD
ncbi:MAG: hypothetical protein FJ403_02400 [Verrucomicrobia bacterium]|nr:hypothetical protein [Verrucomicrobiota bacterium]